MCAFQRLNWPPEDAFMAGEDREVKPGFTVTMVDEGLAKDRQVAAKKQGISDVPSAEVSYWENRFKMDR